ncbi:MAG: ABC transporter permease [Thermoprotei archaeon]|nr:MAG: ABC transporter permease [Thermoprotei archaeon]HDJ97517.1 ABC transporter permease [Thermofilum sp.]
MSVGKKAKNVLYTFVIDPLKIIVHNKAGLIGFIGLLIYIFMAIAGPYIVPLDTIPKPEQRYLPPSWEHPLGTDFEGKDIFSQIVNGARDVLFVAFLAGTITVLIATVLGSIAGFKGGLWDNAIMAVDEILLTIPQFPLLSVLAALTRLDNFTLALVIGVLSWPALARAIRSQVLSLKERDFIEAARALGLDAKHIVFTEIMPNLMSYIVVSWILSMTGAVYSQVGLVFLGFVPFTSHNWGVMINLAWTWGAIYYKNSVWYIISPIMAITGFQLSAILFSRALEEIFNPRLRE